MASFKVLAATAWIARESVFRPEVMLTLFFVLVNVDRIIPGLLWLGVNFRSAYDYVRSLPNVILDYRGEIERIAVENRDGLLIFLITAYFLWKILEYYWPKVEAAYTNSIGFTPERVLPGSILESQAIQPDFQASVFTDRLDNPKLLPRGQCFRYKQYLMTVAHVLEGSSNVRIVSTRFDKDQHKFVDHQLDLELTRFKVIDVDLAIAELLPKEWSSLCMSSAKVANSIPTHGMVVKVSAFGQQSHGMLRQHSAFGLLQYEGSTRGGFSGAPYHIQNTVFGIHAGGDTLNVGFDITYVTAILRELPYSPEDSADYLEQQVRRYGGDFDWEPSPVSPGEFRVRVGGAYHIVDSDVLDELQQKVGKKGRYVQDLREYDAEDISDSESFLAEHPEEIKDFPRVPKARLAEDLQPIQRGDVTYHPEALLARIQTLLATTVDASDQTYLLTDQPAAPSSSVGPGRLAEYQSPSVTTNSATYTPESTRAPRRNHSNGTTTNGGQRKKKYVTALRTKNASLEEENRKLKEQLQQPSKATTDGGSTSARQ